VGRHGITIEGVSAEKARTMTENFIRVIDELACISNANSCSSLFFLLTPRVDWAVSGIR
jgi:hypothetical protein